MLPASVTSINALEKAFYRVIRGSNKDYKQYFRHLYPSYSLALPEILERLSADLKSGVYSPNQPIRVYQPKASGVLRPLALLSVTDQIVYQSLVGYIADRMHDKQKTLALRKRFGALYAGSTSLFFFRSWKQAYTAYNLALKNAFLGGKTWVAEFDLVSYYELIDHSLLRDCLSTAVKSGPVLDALFDCLACWTTSTSSPNLRHGVPQGPEPSAFLAECFLFAYDELPLRDVTYLRYVDDIRLLATSESPLRRALLRLDLASKDRGLVPQAQKISARQCTTVSEVIKSIPSALAGSKPALPKKAGALLKVWRKSMKKLKGRWQIEDSTKFRFALYRLGKRRDVLRRCADLIGSRPDMAGILSTYFRRFESDREAADLLLTAMRGDPTFDYTAAAYIDALDICEPSTKTKAYRQVVNTARNRSAENSVLVRRAAMTFRAKRVGVPETIKLIRAEAEEHVVGMVVSRICTEAGGTPYSVTALRDFLKELTKSPNGDLARHAAALLIEEAAQSNTTWQPPRSPNRAVAELLVALGLRKRGARRQTAIAVFLERMDVIPTLNWKAALGSNLRGMEHRAIRLQRLRLLDPSAFVLLLDTFNEALSHALARKHPLLSAAFATASGGNPHPDFGNWVRNGTLVQLLPVSSAWFLAVHEMRLNADLAHAALKKGPDRGKATKPIKHGQVSKLMGDAKEAWTEMIRVWKPQL